MGGGGIEPKTKRAHGHRQQCGDCQGWEAGGGWVEVKEGIRGINGNRKKYNEK